MGTKDCQQLFKYFHCKEFLSCNYLKSYIENKNYDSSFLEHSMTQSLFMIAPITCSYYYSCASLTQHLLLVQSKKKSYQWSIEKFNYVNITSNRSTTNNIQIAQRFKTSIEISIKTGITLKQSNVFRTKKTFYHKILYKVLIGITQCDPLALPLKLKGDGTSEIWYNWERAGKNMFGIGSYTCASVFFTLLVMYVLQLNALHNLYSSIRTTLLSKFHGFLGGLTPLLCSISSTSFQKCAILPT